MGRLYSFLLCALLLFAIGGLSACGGGSAEPECQDGETRDSTIACGLNDEGLLVEACSEAGLFEVTDTCTGTDVCVDDTMQIGTTVCGLNEEGVLMQDCTEGAWVDNETCTGDDACVNGETQEGTTACGLNDEGVLMQDCTDGQWVDNETCTGDDALSLIHI